MRGTSTTTATAGAFAQQGFAELPGWLSAEQTTALRLALDPLITGPYDQACVRPNNVLIPLRWNHTVVRMLTDDAQMERLATAIRALDLRWISGYVSTKDPESPPLWWHQDWWCWDHPVSLRREPAQVAVLCYLQDTDPTNGALRVLPASHARSVPVHAALPEAHAESAATLSPDHPALCDQPGQRTLAVGAGDAAVLDYRLLHGTHANLTARRRDCVILNFAPNWRGLPPDLRSHLIQHPALPNDEESVHDAWASRLLPEYDGPRADLPLSRDAPAVFAVDDS